MNHFLDTRPGDLSDCELVLRRENGKLRVFLRVTTSPGSRDPRDRRTLAFIGEGPDANTIRIGLPIPFNIEYVRTEDST